jgi:acyl-CoA thioester hydrolase
LEGARHLLDVRVYYEDTDFSGVVYHASYLRFLERGRTEWLRALGITQRRLHEADDALAFVVRRMSIDWIRPAHMDDILTIETWASQVGGASLTLTQRALRGAQTLVEASVLVAATSGGKARRLPLDARERLAKAADALPASPSLGSPS